MADRTCPTHGQPIRGDANLCSACRTNFERDLGDLPALIDEIETTLSRQTATADRVGGRSDEAPLPFNYRAAGTFREVHKTLRQWVHQLLLTSDRVPVNEPAPLARWMHGRLDRLVQHPLAVELANDIAGLVYALRRGIDLGPELLFAGPCGGTITDDDGERPCVELDPSDPKGQRLRPTELYAVAGKPVLTCRRCRTRYDVEERRVWLLAEAQGVLAHAELIGRAAPALGVDITPAAVRGYADRGRIVPHGTDVQGRPLYRLGDVIDVARDVLARRAEQVEKRRLEQEKAAAKRAEREARSA